MTDDVPSLRLPRGKTPKRKAAQKVKAVAAAAAEAAPVQQPEAPPPPPTGRWGRDVLGEDFEARTFPQPDDEEGAVVTTLIRHRPGRAPLPRRPRFAVLYVHGWADYFIQTELAQFWSERGAVFYAVDLRKSGRSIRPHQTPCFVESLEEYDEDLDLAVDVIRNVHGAAVPILLMAHSQGGLTGALWAKRHPGTFLGIVMNSPFLEIHGSSLARAISHPVVSQVARRQARWPVPIAAPSFYDRTINEHEDGEGTIEPTWRPVPTHPIRPGWVNAVMSGHKTLGAKLDLDIPILVMTSHRTVIGSKWREEMRTADVVIDVKQVWRRVPDLGRTVTLARIQDAVHDVLLSPHPVRDHAYDQIDRWFRGYIEPELPPAPATSGSR